MALPHSREELKQYCLRKLGQPVIRINVDSNQLEDRLDEALEMFCSYHFDGIEKIYYKHKVTASVMRFTPALVSTMSRSELFVGMTSGATGKVHDQAVDNLSIRFITQTGTFIDGETITSTSGVTGIIATNGITLGNVDTGYFTVPDNIVAVSRVLPVGSSYSHNMFDIRYQMAMNNVFEVASMDLVSYDITRRHINLINEMLVGQKGFEYNRVQNRVHLQIDWKQDVSIDQYLMVETESRVDPESFNKVYSDIWVRKYTTALFKKQWADNLSKHSGIAIAGQVTLNASTLMAEANREIDALEIELDKKYQSPPEMQVG